MEHHGATDRQQDSLANDADGLGAWSVDGVDLARLDVGISIDAHHVPVMDGVVNLPIGGSDNTDAVERLREIAEHVGDAVAHALVARLRCSVEPPRQQEEGRNGDGDGDHGEDGAHDEQDDRDHDHRQSLKCELAQAILEKLLEVLDVTGHPRHHDAGLLLRVEVEAEALQMGEDPKPEVLHDARREPARCSDLRPLRQRADQDDNQVGDRRGHDHVEVQVALAHALVDGDRRQRGSELGGDGDDDNQKGRPHEQSGVLRQESSQRDRCLLACGGERGEPDGGFRTLGFGGQDLVDPVLELGGDPGEGEACLPARSASSSHWRAGKATTTPAEAAAPTHQRAPSEGVGVGCSAASTCARTSA